MSENYIRSILLSETIQRPVRAHVEFPVGDRRRGSAPILQIVDAKQLPLSAGLDHRDLALFADRINISSGRHRRGEVLAERSQQSSLFEDFTGLDIEGSENAALLQRV